MSVPIINQRSSSQCSINRGKLGSWLEEQGGQEEQEELGGQEEQVGTEEQE
jgi:hypothetical protein